MRLHKLIHQGRERYNIPQCFEGFFTYAPTGEPTSACAIGFALLAKDVDKVPLTLGTRGIAKALNLHHLRYAFDAWFCPFCEGNKPHAGIISGVTHLNDYHRFDLDEIEAFLKDANL